MSSGSLADFQKKYGTTPSEYRRRQAKKKEERIQKQYNQTYKGQQEITAQHKQLILEGKKNIKKVEGGFTYTKPIKGVGEARLPLGKTKTKLEKDYVRFNMLGRDAKKIVEDAEYYQRYEEDPRSYSIQETIQKGIIDPFVEGAEGVGNKLSLIATAGAASLKDFGSSSWDEKGESVAGGFALGGALFASTFTGMGESLRAGTGWKDIIEIDWQDRWDKKGGVRAGKFWASPYAKGMKKMVTGKAGDISETENRIMFRTAKVSSELAGEMGATYAAFKIVGGGAKLTGKGLGVTKDLFGKGVTKVGTKVHSKLDSVIRSYKTNNPAFSSEPSLGAGGLHPFKSKMDFGADFSKTGFSNGEYVSGAYRYARTKAGLEDRLMKALMSGNEKLYRKLTKQKMASVNWKPDYGYISRVQTEQLSRKTVERSPFGIVDERVRESLAFTEKMDMGLNKIISQRQQEINSKAFQFMDASAKVDSTLKQLTFSALLSKTKAKSSLGLKIMEKEGVLFGDTDTLLFQKDITSTKTKTKTRTKTRAKTTLFPVTIQEEVLFAEGMTDSPIFDDDGGGDGGGSRVNMAAFGWGLPKKKKRKGKKTTKKKKKKKRTKRTYAPSLGGIFSGGFITKVPKWTTGVGIRKPLRKKKVKKKLVRRKKRGKK